MAAELVMSIISIVVVIGLFALMILSKRLHYAAGALLLLAVGILNLLFEFQVIDFDINQFPVVHFAVYFMIILAGKDLLKAGVKEEQPWLKWPSISLGIILIIMTTIPTLYKFKVISFTFPEYSPIIDSVIYSISGAFLLIAVFTLLGED